LKVVEHLSLGQRLRLGPARVRAAAIDHAIHAFARVRYLMPDAHPGRYNVAVDRDVVYGPTPALHHRLDVYIPTRAAKPLPVVMYVHGGAFSMLSKETHRVMALAIASQGYLVFNINYRLGPRYLYPAPLEDVCDALVWVHEHCERYGGDARRLAVAGESAGANLVTALAVAHAWQRPEPFARRVFDAGVALRAVVSTYGFLDLTYLDRYLANPKIPLWAKAMLYDAAKCYVGPDARTMARSVPLANPLLLIEKGEKPARPLPPFFIAVGTRDPLMRCSKRLKAALDERGTECMLHVSPGEIHGFDAMVWRPRAREKWRAVHGFLAEHL
jgi:acetyl esterase/lipase